MRKIISGLVVICGLAGCMTQSEVDAINKAARIGAAKATPRAFFDNPGDYAPNINIAPNIDFNKADNYENGNK